MGCGASKTQPVDETPASDPAPPAPGGDGPAAPPDVRVETLPKSQPRDSAGTGSQQSGVLGVARYSRAGSSQRGSNVSDGPRKRHGTWSSLTKKLSKGQGRGSRKLSNVVPRYRNSLYSTEKVTSSSKLAKFVDRHVGAQIQRNATMHRNSPKMGRATSRSRLAVDDGNDGAKNQRRAVLFQMIESTCKSTTSTFTHTTKVQQQSVLNFPKGIIFDPDCWSRPITPITPEMIDLVYRDDYDALAYSREELLLHWFIMFQELDLFNRFKIHPETLHNFFLTIGNTYRDNKYHNFHHAQEVTQFAFYFAQRSQRFNGEINDIALFSVMIAAIAHDMDHPGVNNDFLIRTEDPISLLYNDHSVLENSHCAALFFMMRTRPETNVFENLTEEEFSYSRKLIMECILSTDMAAHFTQIKEFTAKLVPPDNPVGATNLVPPAGQLDTVEKDPVSRQFLLSRLLIKSADLSHIQQPYDQAEKWDHRIHGEFFDQGDKEKGLGFVPDTLFDRNTAKTLQSDHWFYKNMGVPLMELLAKVAPDPGKDVVGRVAGNIAIFAEEMEAEIFHGSPEHNKLRLTWIGPETGRGKRKVTAASWDVSLDGTSLCGDTVPFPGDRRSITSGGSRPSLAHKDDDGAHLGQDLGAVFLGDQYMGPGIHVTATIGSGGSLASMGARRHGPGDGPHGAGNGAGNGAPSSVSHVFPAADTPPPEGDATGARTMESLEEVPLPDDGVDDTMDDVGSEGVRIGSMAVGKAGSSGSPPGFIKIDSLHHPDDIAESNAA